MKALVHDHPFLTDFLVLLTVVLASLPLWSLPWVILAQYGQVYFEQGCQIRTGCYYDSLNFIVVSLLILPAIFSAFIWQVTRTAEFISTRTLRWAGLDPKVALA